VARDGRKRGIRDALEIFPLCLFSGLLFTVPVWLLSHLGPELPTLLGSLFALPVFLLCVKKGFLVPKTVYRFMDDPIPRAEGESPGIRSLAAAWSPYLVIAALLTLSRLPWLPLARLLSDPAVTITVPGLFGFRGIDWTWAVLNNPGLLPFLPVALIYLLAHKTPGMVLGRLFIRTLRQLQNAVLALLFGVALVQVMRYTNYSDPGAGLFPMTTEIARAAASAFGAVYPLVCPLVGSLGAFVSGSHTVSNVMFYGLQIEIAEILGLPMVLVLIGQTSGASIGNMVAIHNAVSISATTGAQGSEGKMIAAAALPFLLCNLAISGILFLYLALGRIWVG